mgnify:FL=1
MTSWYHHYLPVCMCINQRVNCFLIHIRDEQKVPGQSFCSILFKYKTWCAKWIRLLYRRNSTIVINYNKNKSYGKFKGQKRIIDLTQSNLYLLSAENQVPSNKCPSCTFCWQKAPMCTYRSTTKHSRYSWCVNGTKPSFYMWNGRYKGLKYPENCRYLKNKTKPCVCCKVPPNESSLSNAILGGRGGRGL